MWLMPVQMMHVYGAICGSSTSGGAINRGADVSLGHVGLRAAAKNGNAAQHSDRINYSEL